MTPHIASQNDPDPKDAATMKQNHIFRVRAGLFFCDCDVSVTTSPRRHSTFHGLTWTNDLSWVRGYENVLEPMQQLSARFHEVFDSQQAEDASITTTDQYRDALLHLLLLETSCFRYWGQGLWTDFAREIHRRGESLLMASRTD